MAKAAIEMPSPFRPPDVVDWFADRYPLVRSTTVRAHVIGLTDNHASRRHYTWLAQRQPLFHQEPDGSLVLFDPDVHITVGTEEGGEGGSIGQGPPAEEPAAEPHEFYLEAHLEQFLVDNWSRIPWGRSLRIWEDPSGRSGHQLATPVGRLDFLCQDVTTGNLVVVELKRGSPADRVVGQTARYMGWVSMNLSDGRPVDGIVVAHEADERLRYAIHSVPQMSLLLYEVAFTLAPAPPPTAASSATGRL